MAVSSANSKVLQVQIPVEMNTKLDEIATKSHIAKSVIIRMGIERILKDVEEGRIQMGIRFGQ